MVTALPKCVGLQLSAARPRSVSPRAGARGFVLQRHPPTGSGLELQPGLEPPQLARQRIGELECTREQLHRPCVVVGSLGL
jgi:hypothetical protein